jgi:DNA modification methylase
VNVHVIQGDARHLPLPDASVDLICTSPPYFALRSYQDNGRHYHGQIGSENTPHEWLEAMWDCTREWARVLKPEGSMFVNLGDKYSQRVAIRPSSHQDGLFPNRPELRKSWRRDRAEALTRMPYQNVTDPDTGQYPPEKSLMGLPWRYAIGCIDQLGLILRAEIIWNKPNGLPESVTDRVRRSHEQWFHLVKQPRYYAAVDEIRESYATSSIAIYRRGGLPHLERAAAQPIDSRYRHDGDPESWRGNPLGKLPGSVWTIPTEPLSVPDHLGIDHYAAYPLEWPLRIIVGWTPVGICTRCGEGRRPVTEACAAPVGVFAEQQAAKRTRDAGPDNWRLSTLGTPASERRRNITSYVCACPTPAAPTRPALVLDPFGGTGTTALAARALDRTALTLDLSHDYTRLAQWRTTDRAELAKAMRVDKPPTQVNGQLDMFEQAAP